MRLRLWKRKEAPQNATMKEPEWWRQLPLMMKSSSGENVTESNALQIAAVYACVRVLAETIAGLPVKVYRRTPKGREVVHEHPVAMLLNGSPNSTQTAFELLEFIMSNLGLRGNAYAHKVINGTGRVVALQPLYAQYMRPKMEGGKLLFHYAQPGYERTYAAAEIWRVAGIGSDGITGMSPISLARESLGLAMAAESSAAHMYANGAPIPGVLEFPHKLSDEVIEHLRNQWADRHGGAENAHKPLILESGMKYSQIGMNARDAQFLEARKFQISEIARWYRVPLHKLGELDRATFSNIEHQSIEFVTDTILPWCRRIEQTIQRDLFTESERRTLFVRFNLDGLLRGDTATRYEAYGKAINDGWLSRNEVRSLENHNPVDGLDEYLVPLNMSQASESDRITNWLATRELNALNNCNQENQEQWAQDFYARHAETLRDLSGLSAEQCAAYAVRRIDTLKQHGLSAAKASAINTLREALRHE